MTGTPVTANGGAHVRRRRRADPRTLRWAATFIAALALAVATLLALPTDGQSVSHTHVDVGSPADVRAGGDAWSADVGWTDGTIASTTSPIAGTGLDAVYQSYRYGEFTYSFAVPVGVYEVALHFVEPYWDETGRRIFSVGTEDRTLVRDLDVYAVSGGRNRAHVESVRLTVADGILDLTLTAGIDQAILSGMEYTLVQSLGREQAPELGAGPSGVPMPRGGVGDWPEVFSDDFDGHELDKDKWFSYQGQPAGDPGGYFDSSHVKVRDGLLVIEGYRDSNLGGRWVTGGVNNRHAASRTYGRYEVRMRLARGRGIAHAILLWPKSNIWPPEIDFSEDNGTDRRKLYATVHNSPPRPRRVQRSTAVDLTQWNTVGVIWTEGSLAYLLNGRTWATVSGDVVPNIPMSLAIQTQAWYCGHGWMACPSPATPPRVDLEVDWVKVYAPPR